MVQHHGEGFMWPLYCSKGAEPYEVFGYNLNMVNRESLKEMVQLLMDPRVDTFAVDSQGYSA